MAEQQNWRWCHKCKSIHYDQVAGVCSAGGAHDASQSMWYSVPTTAPTEVSGHQGNWRKCKKCQVLFLGAGAQVCPAGGTHDGTGSAEYWLATVAYPANGSQAGWVGCTKCLQVCQPYLGLGKCPAGGDHSNTNGGSYHMKLGYPEVSQTSPTFGGPGGHSFNDSAVLTPSANFGPIRQIFIRAGDHIDSIGVGYTNGTRFTHGTSMGGTAHTITLDEGEFIHSVSGSTDNYVKQITFHTHKRSYGPYGAGGGTAFSVNFLGCALQYLFGRADEFVDQIGFGYGRQLGTLPAVVTRADAVGGPGGTAFDDVASNGPLLGKVKRIVVRHGEVVDNLKVLYSSGTEIAHGENTGTEEEFVIHDDEWLTEVRGKANVRVDSIQFVLSSGRTSPIYGGPGGNPYSFKKKGCTISGFFGRAGDHIEQLGVVYDTAKPKKVVIKSISYDLNNFRLNEKPKALTSITVLNNSSREQTTSSSLTDEVSETETFSLTVTEGVTVEIGFEVETGVEVVKTKETVKFGFSLEVATTTEYSATKTRTISHEVTTVTAPHSSLKATARVTEGTYDVPWSATGVVTYYDGTESETVTMSGKLQGVQCYGQSVVYEDLIAPPPST